MKQKTIKLIVISIFIILTAIIIVLFIEKNKKRNDTLKSNNEVIVNESKEVEEVKHPEIFSGRDRPIAIMIDNVGDARPQAGLNDAFIVYEIIVEGNQTRLMAVFKNKNLDKIGPIRSSRHYFLDYALENDAIYTHFGWSPQAKSDISKLSVENINGLNESSKTFWRVKDKSAPHNVVTSTEKLTEVAKRKGYSTKSNKKSVLNYSIDEVELENGDTANNIIIPYSSSYKVTYKYDDEKKVYVRGYNKTTQKDWQTKEMVTTKNIILTFAKNTTLDDGSGKGRQTLQNIGKLDGYYITNGRAIKIECYKSSRKEQTVYKDLEGNEINVNDGNTFIQIVPIDKNVTIE